MYNYMNLYIYMFLWYLIYFAKFNNYEFYIDICTDMSGIIIIIEIINTIVFFTAYQCLSEVTKQQSGICGLLQRGGS